MIWRHISRVDSIGRENLIKKCGSESLKDLIAGARNIAKLLTVMRKSVKSSSNSLECSRIHPIYAKAVHEIACTEAASASSYGFLFFFILAILTTILITIRASWLQHTMEEKVYHDEDEVAENMIVDEHEEYLAYISKYKHEWQEYEGIENTASANHSANSSSYRSQSEGSISVFEDEDSELYAGGYNGSDECSGLTDPDAIEMDISKVIMRLPSADESCATGEISFPSLGDNRSEGTAEDVYAVPPSMLAPSTSDKDWEERDEDGWAFRTPLSEVVGDLSSSVGEPGRASAYSVPRMARRHEVPSKFHKAEVNGLSIEVPLSPR